MPRPTFTAILALLLPALCAPVARPASASEVVERDFVLMGTRASLRVEAADRAAALEASEAAVRALEAAEERLSTWGGPAETEGATRELAHLNGSPVDRPVRLSPALAEELRRAQACRRATGGAFDPGVGALVAAWGLRSGGRKPNPAELSEARQSSGADLELEETDRGPVAIRRDAGLRIEEGGFGKGAGLDAALEVLEADPRVLAAELDLGGQVALLRRRSDAARAEIVLAHPRDRDRVVARLAVGSGSVATSGNGERGLMVDGQELGHLLDPRTGRPARDFGSLTVWAPRALEADCLATGLYVLGPERALAWAEEHEGIEVAVARAGEDGRVVIEHTSGLAGRLAPLKDGVRVVRAQVESDEKAVSPPADAGIKAGAGAGKSVTSEVPSPRSPTDDERRVAARRQPSGADGNPRH